MENSYPFSRLLSDFSLLGIDEASSIIDLLKRIRIKQNQVLNINDEKQDEIDKLFDTFFLSTKKRTTMLSLTSKLLSADQTTPEELKLAQNLQRYGCVELIHLEDKEVLLVSPEGIALLKALISAKPIGRNFEVDYPGFQESLSRLEGFYRKQARSSLRRLERSIKRRTLNFQQVAALVLLLLIGAIGEENKIINIDVHRDKFENFTRYFFQILDLKTETKNIEKRLFRGESLSNFLSHSNFETGYSLFIKRSSVRIVPDKIEYIIKKIGEKLEDKKIEHKFLKNWPLLRNKSIKIKTSSPDLARIKFDPAWDDKLSMKIRNTISERK